MICHANSTGIVTQKSDHYAGCLICLKIFHNSSANPNVPVTQYTRAHCLLLFSSVHLEIIPGVLRAWLAHYVV